MKIVILVGVPGCGKSSILKETVRQLPSVTIINYGDHMLKEAALNGLDRDMLRKMPIAAQQKIGVEAAKKIVLQKSEIAIVDTHALVRTRIGFCPGLPKEVLEILSPKACVWIECSPSLILQRRLRDQTRNRDEETEEELSGHKSGLYPAKLTMPIYLSPHQKIDREKEFFQKDQS
jgi:adenylate kinase